MTLRSPLVCLALFCAACGGGASPPVDAGTDARHHVADASAEHDAPGDAPSEAHREAAETAPDATAPFDATVPDGGSSDGSGLTDAITDAGVEVGPLFFPIDASTPVDGSVSTVYPAFLPYAPRVVSNGGPVLTSPVFVPLVVEGDPDLTQIEAFLAAVGPSQYWRSATSEYGVGAGAAAPPIVCPPDALEDGGIGTCLTHAMSGDGGLSGLVAGSNGVAMFGTDGGSGQPLVVFFLPEGASFGVVGCDSLYGGIHGAVTIAGVTVVFATVSRCASDGGVPTAFDSMTGVASHELAESATDPLPPTGNAGLDPEHQNWFIPGLNSPTNVEVGDMCELTPQVHPSEPELAAFSVQRIWSNASIAAGHDPCVPEPRGEVFYEAVPILPDEVEYGATGFVPCVAIPSGGTRAIDLALYSDGDPGGPWNVGVAQDFPTGLSFGLSQQSGRNGSVLSVMIDAQVDAGLGYTQAWVSSTMGDASAENIYRWPLGIWTYAAADAGTP